MSQHQRYSTWHMLLCIHSILHLELFLHAANTHLHSLHRKIRCTASPGIVLQSNDKAVINVMLWSCRIACQHSAPFMRNLVTWRAVLNARLMGVISCLHHLFTIAIMQGDWLCPSCISGTHRRGRKCQTGTAREHLLAGGKKLALVQIQALWQESHGSQCFAGRWYEIPDNTHTGRQVRLHASIHLQAHLHHCYSFCRQQSRIDC